LVANTDGPIRSDEDLGGVLETPKSPGTLPLPAARFVAVANSDPSPIADDFEPTAAHRALSTTLFETQATSFLELAEKSGVSRSHIYRILEEPDAVKWIVANSARTMELALAAVHARLLHKALNDKTVSALKLYLQRFDKDFKVQSNSVSGENVQINNFSSYSLDELERLAGLKERRLGVAGGREGKDSSDNEGIKG